MNRQNYNLVVVPPGTVFLDRWEIVCSNEAVSRAVNTERDAQLALDKAKRLHREDPQNNPKPWVMTEFFVRPSTAEEIARSKNAEQENAVLKFLRGGRP